MTNLQTLLFPKLEICTEEDMYYRRNENVDLLLEDSKLTTIIQ